MKTVAAMTQEWQSVGQPCLAWAGLALHGLACHERSAIEEAGQVSLPDPGPGPGQCTGGCQASGTNGPAGILSQTGLYVRFGSSLACQILTGRAHGKARDDAVICMGCSAVGQGYLLSCLTAGAREQSRLFRAARPEMK